MSVLELSTHSQEAILETDQKKIGDLRRRYNFGSQVSELGIDQTPFFRFLSQVGVSPTDDPEFKIAEERSMWHKRYAYVTAMDLSAGDAAAVGTDDSAYDNYTFADGDLAQDQTFSAKFETDYKSAGNVQSILGQTAIAVGASGTKPIFMLDGQLIKIPLKVMLTATSNDVIASKASQTSADYMIVRILNLVCLEDWVCFEC